MFFFGFFSPLELRGAHLVIYQRSLEKGIYIYNVLCFHRYFDVMLFFIGNSQCFCISSKFPSAVSQLFFSVSAVPWCFFEH